MCFHNRTVIKKLVKGKNDVQDFQKKYCTIAYDAYDF